MQQVKDYPLVDCPCLFWADDGTFDRAEYGGHHKTCTAPFVVGDLRLFRVDEGIDHWVLAKDGPDALALVCELHEYNPKTWDAEAIEYTLAMAEKDRFRDDDGTTRSMRAECERDPQRRYIACSEQ